MSSRPDINTWVIYGSVATLAIGSAFLISLKFLGRTAAQPSPNPAQNPASSPATPDAAAPAPGANPGAEATSAPSTKAEPKPSPEGVNSTAVNEIEGFLEPFIYDVVNRRDPFLPYAEVVTAEVGEGGKTLTPAQRFELDQLHLIGIMWDIRDPKAMFMDPENEVLVLGRDEGIGNRNGYIATIREGEVVVVESQRKRGDLIYKTRVLRLER